MIAESEILTEVRQAFAGDCLISGPVWRPDLCCLEVLLRERQPALGNPTRYTALLFPCAVLELPGPVRKSAIAAIVRRARASYDSTVYAPEGVP